MAAPTNRTGHTEEGYDINEMRARITRLQRAVATLDDAYAGEYGNGPQAYLDIDTAEWLGLRTGDVPPEAYHYARNSWKETDQ